GAFERLMKALGMEEFVGSEETNRMGKPMTAEAAKRMVEKAEQVFASRPRAEWMRLLEEADVPNRPVLRPGECFADEQVQAIDMVVSVEDPGLGPLRQVGLPLKFAQTPGHIRGPAPLPGQHNDEVLARLGYSQEERAAFRRQGVV
ncbi:MAG: CoA transferase, partial [Chloroflexi bacterium]|nr:CoA transferase [Chloroflexota bacterium]